MSREELASRMHLSLIRRASVSGPAIKQKAARGNRCESRPEWRRGLSLADARSRTALFGRREIGISPRKTREGAREGGEKEPRSPKKLLFLDDAARRGAAGSTSSGRGHNLVRCTDQISAGSRRVSDQGPPAPNPQRWD